MITESNSGVVPVTKSCSDLRRKKVCHSLRMAILSFYQTVYDIVTLHLQMQWQCFT